MTERLARRLREFHSRTTIRAWEYRQRGHASGTWFRFRRVLAAAKDAYAVSSDEAAGLAAEGWRREPVGDELAPKRLILVVPEDRVARLASARRLALRLDAELLGAPCLVLVPFAPEAKA